MLCPIFLEARPPGMRFEPTSFTVKAKDVTTGPRIHVQIIWPINMEWKQNAKSIYHPNEDDFRGK
jgi:hypothetical protein